DGTTFVAVEFDQWNDPERSVSAVDAASGKLVRKITRALYSNGHSLLSPNGRLLASADSESIRIWDLDKGTKIRDIACPHNHNSRMDISADGKILAVATTPSVNLLSAVWSSVRLWDIATGERLAQQNAHDTLPTSLAFAPDAKTL